MARSGIVFVVPPGRPPSGGDLYNRFLLRALKDEGFAFRSTTLEGLNAGAFLPRTELWVDSLYIPRLAAADPFRPDVRLFFVIHSLPSEDPGLPSAAAAKLKRAEDRLFPEASGFLVTGPRTRDILVERDLGDRPILLVPPALCVRPKGAPQTPAVFTGLIVSSLIRGKGVPDLLEALGREAGPNDDFFLRIAGRTDIEPETAAACLASAASHPLLAKRVTHLGFRSLEQMAGEYERGSVLISPSSSETYGMAFHEARAFGLPILALRAPHSEPYIDPGRTGLLFESVTDLAKGLLELVRRPERMAALAKSAAADRPADAYSWADAARSFLIQRQAVLYSGPARRDPGRTR